jgi:hypothetical protein
MTMSAFPYLSPLRFDAHYGAVVVDADAATIAVDCAVGDRHAVSPAGDRTLTLVNFQVGQEVTIEVIQPATGGPITLDWQTPIRWDGGAAPTLATATGQVDLITLYKRPDGTILGRRSFSERVPVAATGDLSYTHTQAVPAATWVIVHGLGKYPAVTVVDSAGTRVYGDEVQVDLNTVRLDFLAAFSGRAFLN